MKQPKDAANAFECWEWQERQAKFIVNSCRVYEFWGYDWQIPLWDNEMMDFWSRVPLALRAGKRLYDRLLEKALFKDYDINFHDHICKYSLLGKIRNRMPFYHDWWGYTSFSKILEIYPVYREYFGFSRPPFHPINAFLAYDIWELHQN